MALLAIVALGEAGRSVCGSGQAHGQMPVMAAVELTLVDHGHHGHDGYDCEEAVATAEAVTDDHCPDCALGLSCSECAMLTATRVAEIEVFQPVQSSSPTVLYTAIAPRRITHFDPPPPKVLTSI